MRSILARSVRSIDWPLVGALSVLMAIGLVLAYSISTNPVSPNPALFRKQLIYVLAGICAFVFFSTINYRIWMVYSKVIYLGCIVALVGVLVVGVTIRGTTGWISLGITTFQPVEFAKIGLIFFLAKYFSDHGRHFFLWRHTIISGIATVALIGLVLVQPDFGSAIVLAGIWFLMLLVVGIPRKHVIALISIFLIAAAIGWMFVLKPYQKDRIMTFLNPQLDTQGVGYNVRQSIIAVGSGRIIGRGFGLGSQSQLKFLPEAETDFIFAVLAEEFGLVGALTLLAGLLFLVYRLVATAQRTQDNFAAYSALGLASLLTVQSFVNIGMNVGLAPVTGIPLPFLSSGGSSLLSLCIAFGIMSNIIYDVRTRGSHSALGFKDRV
ncbi:MAG: rod shape-determining protein RodA [Candidatus Komeilibacteria bacterium]|nr:rod shape-determining protein RodA [Candidatus Komeilibacteria bacterium]